MAVILGVDIGGSTTKIIGYRDDGQFAGMLQVRATDQITSMYGAIGHFLHKYKLTLQDVSKIVLTGVGASLIHEDLYGIPTTKMQEFKAIGLGGLHQAGLDEAIVISMGTGTAFVYATKHEARHLGGSGVGGGTLVGLASKLLHEDDIQVVSMMADQGDLDNVDLLIRDISTGEIPNLPPYATAANFGKIKNTATKADMALGLFNMIYQTVGTLGVFAARGNNVDKIVLTGSLTAVPQAEAVFKEMSDLYGMEFIIPPAAVFATAIGTALDYE